MCKPLPATGCRRNRKRLTLRSPPRFSRSAESLAWLRSLFLPALLLLHVAAGRLPSVHADPRAPASYGGQAVILDATNPTPASTPDAAQQAAAGERHEAPTPSTMPAGEAPPFSRDTPFRTTNQGDREPENGSTLPWATVVSSLAIVLGLFGGLVLILRRSGSVGMGGLDKEFVQVLGRTPLGPRQQLTLVRCGNRVLVLAVGASTTAPLSEITDPDEVNRLIAASKAGSQRQFQQTIQAIGREKPPTDRFIETPPPRKSSLFTSA